ncbi:peptide chain release factor [Raphidocelis subcapitata]|uniref:Peptide chain release factor n=1 Tax=Raphidocelis subcapitata TaxID=307507 RepID=A0A2V0NYK5_9CHLO|nr:peptide chain release factor [Raphidocelis subcapitata]|eukprot:GBF90670.1 peptide chain release factor [Raphidocelis subcapitata]
MRASRLAASIWRSRGAAARSAGGPDLDARAAASLLEGASEGCQSLRDGIATAAPGQLWAGGPLDGGRQRPRRCAAPAAAFNPWEPPRQQARCFAASAAPDRDALVDQRLKALSDEHAALQAQLHGGSIDPSSDRYQQASRHAGMLQVVADGYAEIARLRGELVGVEEMLAAEGSEELREMAREEKAALQQRMYDVRESLVAHLLPIDDDEHRNAVVEVRSGVGGEWAASFAADLLAMYKTYAVAQGWQFELLSASYTDFGGVKAADALVSGPGAFGRLRWESGVHRAQTVPFTEKTGKMQTGTATVAVLAEATEADVTIAETDLKWDTFRASGAGGQHVNTTDSAVRVTHLPTGVVVACQTERSQHQNRSKALRLLRSKVQEAERSKLAAVTSAARQQAHGNARFSERIRTFHYVDGRVTDHRVPGLSVMGGVERVLSGDMLDALIDAVAAVRREEALAEVLESQQRAAAAGE